MQIKRDPKQLDKITKHRTRCKYNDNFYHPRVGVQWQIDRIFANETT
jgi:hypothetical protein